MADTANTETNDDLEGETPSTIREGFQRWLIVSGLLFTLLFIYLFFTMQSDKNDKEAETKTVEEVPQQIQEAPAKSEAIDRFQEDIKSPNRSQYGEKIETASINRAYAPRKTTSYEESKRKADSILKDKQPDKDKQTPYEKYLEAEQMRAFKSITSEDTIGDASGFYEEKTTTTAAATGKSKSKSKPIKRESLESKQNRIREQIDAISEYRKAIERGEVDPSSPPPGLLNLMEVKR